MTKLLAQLIVVVSCIAGTVYLVDHNHPGVGIGLLSLAVLILM